MWLMGVCMYVSLPLQSSSLSQTRPDRQREAELMIKATGEGGRERLISEWSVCLFKSWSVLLSCRRGGVVVVGCIGTVLSNEQLF